MSAPAPGRAPISVPSTLPRSVCRGYFFISAHMPLKTLPIAVCAVSSGAATVIVERITSDTANMPTMIGISSAPPISSGRPKVKRGKPAGLSRPTVATSRPIKQRDHALELVAGGDEHGAGQAEQRQPEIFERAEAQRELGQHRRRQDQHDRAEQAADHREDQAGAQRQLALALARQRIGLVGIGGRGRRARDAQQAARDVAGEDRHGRRRHHRGDGRDRRHEEGGRHQQRRRHGGGEAGYRADEQAERPPRPTTTHST